MMQFSNYIIRCFPVVFIFLATACTSTVKAPVILTDSKVKTTSTASTGSRNQGYHIVSKGDTLYSIAWRYAKNFKQVAAWNGINSPYVIYPEQVIRLKNSANTNQRSSKKNPKTTASSSSKTKKKTPEANKLKLSRPEKTAAKFNWRWPTSGKLVKINLPTSENGLNISGNIGQEIKAAAAGEVVYSGSGLLGYGKLIIIKHSEAYLSAYAHNDKILIKEGMKVTIGQKIATMGIGNNGKPLLHFEIRKDGKPVDPTKYLPKQRS